MEGYNLVSYYLQFQLCLVLLIGFIALLCFYKKKNLPITVLVFGALILELTDLANRLFEFNGANQINYPLSQLLLFVCLVETYALNFIQLKNQVRTVFHVMAVSLFVLSFLSLGDLSRMHMYPNIAVSIVICILPMIYFFKVIKIGKVFWPALTVNLLVFLFFSIESIISLTFNFLVNNYLSWVAPIWLFRGVVLLFFYAILINFGWKVGKNKT